MVTQFIMLYTLLVNHYCCHPVWSYWQKQAKRCRKSQKIWKARKDWGGKIADVSFKNVGNGKMSLMSQANMNDHNRTQHTIPWYFIEYVDNGTTVYLTELDRIQCGCYSLLGTWHSYTHNRFITASLWFLHWSIFEVT